MPSYQRLEEKVKKKPRFVQRIKAFSGSYYWLPCPICGEYYGGHEWDGGSLADTNHSGKMVCPDCNEIAREANQRKLEI
jgi:predicted RNA-binding Zn-ribbon protein involved in translation (DUF1610 family)